MKPSEKPEIIINNAQNQTNPLQDYVEKDVNTLPDADKPEIGPDSLAHI